MATIKRFKSRPRLFTDTQIEDFKIKKLFDKVSWENDVPVVKAG